MFVNHFITKKLAERVGIATNLVQKVVRLLEEGSTIPFIARYRKEVTSGLDEVELASIQTELKNLQEFIKRKESIRASLAEQGIRDEGLQKKIEDCWDSKKLEDLYLPYKRKAKTKASVARDNGLESLAKMIMSQRSNDIRQQAKRFLNKEVKSVDDAILGAQFIIAEWVNENPKVRDIVRSIFARKGILQAKLIKGKNEEGEKFRDYFNFEGSLKKMPSHRLLAILRGETEKILKVKVDVDFDETADRICSFFIKYESEATPFLEKAIEDGLKRLVLPSIRNEVLKDQKDKADEEAIAVFARNAKALLLAPPLGAKKILGIDPGFRSGCKVVSIDELGDLLKNTTIFPHSPQQKLEESERSIFGMLDKYKIQAIAVGNGTAGKETYQWLKSFVKDIDIFLVNEDGASIYSASEIARDEFPDYDITVRGSVSIARRLMDPLAELVKIDPKSIGVGQYQHDVNQKRLKDSLTETVISCVNKVGINVNTASKHLLSYVAGLGPTLAENIVKYRSKNGKIKSINELKKVPRLGAKAYEQCAGFLRVKDGLNPLDNTGVHPESYGIVNKMLRDLDTNISDLIANEKILGGINLHKYITENVGLPSLTDIIEELKKPGLDPREKAKAVEFAEGIENMDDLSIGQELTGVVTNLTKFGAFLDIGIKESALLHISQIVDRFISDPAEVLSINQEVKVQVIDIDKSRKRISVTRKGMS